MSRRSKLAAIYLQAAGLVDLKGLDVFLATAITDGIYKFVNPKLLAESGENARNSIKRNRIDILREISKGLDVSQLALLGGFPLSKLRRGAVLSNRVAELYFERIEFRITGDDSQLTKGVFQSVRNDFATEHPSRIEIFLAPIVQSISYSYWSRRSLFSEVRSTVAHELHHAADWAYSMAGAQDYDAKNHKDLGVDEDGSLNPGTDESYLTQDTEQKSWAQSLALDVFAHMERIYAPSNFSEYMRAPGEDFKRFVTDSTRSEPLKYLKGEDRKKFLQRVFNEVKKLVQGEIAKNAEPEEPSKYKFRKYEE